MVDLEDALASLIGALETSGIRYALGGAHALAVWGVPRATKDIDVTLWFAPGTVDELFEQLDAIGVEGDLEQGRIQARRTGAAYLRWQNVRLDVFVPSIPFYEYAERTRVRLDLPRIGPTWVLSAESLIVFKLLFFRPKDISDVRAIVRIRRDLVDGSAVRAHLVDMVGEDDERVERWDTL